MVTALYPPSETLFVDRVNAKRTDSVSQKRVYRDKGRCCPSVTGHVDQSISSSDSGIKVGVEQQWDKGRCCPTVTVG